MSEAITNELLESTVQLAREDAPDHSGWWDEKTSRMVAIELLKWRKGNLCKDVNAELAREIVHVLIDTLRLLNTSKIVIEKPHGEKGE